MRSTMRLWFARTAILLGATVVVSMIGPVSPQTTAAQATKKAKHTRPSDAIIGEWWTEGRQGRIRFERYKDGTFRGITTWRKSKKHTEDDPAIDVHNPDPKKRRRSTVGIVLIWSLKYDGDGEYIDGYVYNPRDGNVYGMDIEVIDHNTLEIRGYLGIALFGQTQTWKRMQVRKRTKVTSK